MNSMLEKGKKEKHDEQLQFAAYKQFCKDTGVEKTKAIAEANEMIDVLKADIEKYAADAATLTKEISDLEKDMATYEADIAGATKQREKEHADYQKQHDDQGESIQALQEGIEVEKAQMKEHNAAGSFVQLSKIRSL